MHYLVVLASLSTDSRTVHCRPCRPPTVWSAHTSDLQWIVILTVQNQTCCLLWIPSFRLSSWYRPTCPYDCTRMHSSRMRTARSLPYGEVSLTEIPRDRDRWTETPLTETPMERDPPGQRRPWSCYLWCILRQRHPPPVNRITDPCENLTLPQLCWGR